MGLVYQTLGLLMALAALILFVWLAAALRPWFHLREAKAWVASYACLCAGAFLYLVPEVGPGIHLPQYLARNEMLMWCTGLQWIACRWGRGATRTHWVWSFAPVGVLLLAVSFLKASLGGRALAFSLAIFPFLFASAWELYRDRSPARSFLGRLAACLLAFHGLFHLGRAFVILLTWGQTDLVFWVALSFGEALVLMATLAVVIWMRFEQRGSEETLPGGPTGAPVD